VPVEHLCYRGRGRGFILREKEKGPQQKKDKRKETRNSLLQGRGPITSSEVKPDAGCRRDLRDKGAGREAKKELGLGVVMGGALKLRGWNGKTPFI